MDDLIVGPKVNWQMPKLERVWNWHHLYVEHIMDCWHKSRAQQFPFSWNPKEGHNCLTFSALTIKVITEIDLHDMFCPGEYDDAASAYRTMRKLGFTNIEQLIEQILPEKMVESVIPGDLVIVRAPMGEDDVIGAWGAKAAAIADPPFFWCMMPSGLGRGNMDDVLSAYKVGG